jgi:hypothetical protein
MSWAAALLTLLVAIGALPGTAGAQPAAGMITTVAGTGTGGFNGDGLAATSAWITYPYDVAVDTAGNLFIADTHNHRIRRVDAATGLISTVAGTGDQGYNGDGIAATAAWLNYPLSVALDAAGNVYIADGYSYRVRKVDAATGLISTIAGTGVPGYGGDNGPATAALIGQVWGLALNAAGDLFISDLNNYRVRKVDAGTGTMSTFAGNGSGGFSGDGGPATAATLRGVLDVAVDGAGNVYIADYDNNRIRWVSASTGVIDTVAGGNTSAPYCGDGGPATAACLYNPYGVAADAAGNLAISDTFGQRVRYVDAATGIISTVAGTGVEGYNGDGIAATAAQLYYPIGLAFGPAGDVFVADQSNYRIRAIGGRALPVITWANPAGITYGTALSATQLNATADVPGTFVYDPASGTVLNAGAGQTLSTTFTPDDTVTYAPVTQTVRIDVAKATPVITWADPAPITAGTALGATQLNATASVAGTFAYSPPAGTVLAAGADQVLSVLFTPTDAANYNEAARQVTIDVTPAGPVNGPPYTLTVTPPTGGKIHGAGILCGAGYTACSVTMPAAMTLGLSATPSSGYTFTNWTGDCTGTTTSQWVDLQGPRACGAVFTAVAQEYALTIAPLPAGGTVTGGGLTCGTGGATCAVTFGSSTTASLTATADTGYVFAGWGGACSGTGTGTSVTVNGVKTCSATFTASGGGASGPPYTLTVTKPAGGTITGAGINCGAAGNACSVTMPAAMTLGLAAAASTGYTFTAWTGDCTGTAASQWVNLQGPRTCGATFTATGGGGGGTPPGSGIITTVMGTGTPGYDGDGGPATAAMMNYAYEVATDAAGNVYVADFYNHRVRKIDAATGIVTTIAGTGASGFAGDGGPATLAQLSEPLGLAVDGAGNLFISDYGNNRVRRVDGATGIITTVAGTGGYGYSGDGGPATDAQIHGPYGLGTDGSGNLFIADYSNFRVRRVDAATGVISTVAGSGSASYSGDGGPATAAGITRPIGLALDAAGNVYVSDYYAYRVRKVDAATGTITTVAGTGSRGNTGDGGAATAAELGHVWGLAVSPGGDLYLSSHDFHVVRLVAAATGIITTYAGNGTSGFSGDGGPATSAQFYYPLGLALDSGGRLFIADHQNYRIRAVGAGSVAPPDGPPYTLTITPPAGGRIQGAGINCGAGGTACSVTMPAQMTLGLAATPSAGYTFGGWTGHCSGASPSLWLDLKGARTCSATFTAK